MQPLYALYDRSKATNELTVIEFLKPSFDSGLYSHQYMVRWDMIVCPYIVLYHTSILWEIFTTRNFMRVIYTEIHHTNKQSFRYVVTFLVLLPV